MMPESTGPGKAVPGRACSRITQSASRNYHLAAQILAVADEDIRKKLDSKRAADAKKVLEKDAGVMEKLS